MNTRGFTLIELTALIVILSAIFLVSFPSLLNVIRADDEKNYQKMIDNLCLAGSTYINSHSEDFNELFTVGSKINIDIKQLIDYGNVEKGIFNVKTEKVVDNDLLIYTVLEDYTLDCKYIDVT